MVIIDEFPYLIETDDSVVSQFQRIYDEILEGTKVKLVIAGSTITMMLSQVLQYQSPLYGRRSIQINLQQRSFSSVRCFFPNYSLKDQIIAYSMLGGIPAYLHKFDPSKDVLTNMEEQFLDNTSFLFAEGEFLLKEEFREIHLYQKILFGLSKTSKLGEVANFAHKKSTDINKYVERLLEVRLVKVEQPLYGKKKKTHYLYADNYLAFWYTFIYPQRDFINYYQKNIVLENVKKNLHGYVGKIFEQVCHEFLLELLRKGALPFMVTEIGRHWGTYRKGQTSVEVEVDIIAVNKMEKKVLFVECKFQEDITPSTVKKLKEKAMLLPFQEYDHHYGFVGAGSRVTDEERSIVWTYKDLEQAFDLVDG